MARKEQPQPHEERGQVEIINPDGSRIPVTQNIVRYESAVPELPDNPEDGIEIYLGQEINRRRTYLVRSINQEKRHIVGQLYHISRQMLDAPEDWIKGKNYSNITGISIRNSLDTASYAIDEGLYADGRSHQVLIRKQETSLDAVLKTMHDLQKKSLLDGDYYKLQQSYQKVQKKAPAEWDIYEKALNQLISSTEIYKKSEIDTQFKDIQVGVVDGLVPQMGIITEQMTKLDVDMKTMKRGEYLDPELIAGNHKDALMRSMSMLLRHCIEPKISTATASGFESHINKAGNAVSKTIEDSLSYAPVFSLDLLREMYKRISTKKESGDALVHFRRSFSPIAFKVLGYLAGSQIPDQSSENAEKFREVYEEFLAFMSDDDITKDLKKDMIDNGNRQLKSIPKQRFNVNPEDALNMTDDWKVIIDPDAGKAVSDSSKSQSVNEVIIIEQGEEEEQPDETFSNENLNRYDHVKFNQGYAETLMLLMEETKKEQFHNKFADKQKPKEFNNHLFRDLLRWPYLKKIKDSRCAGQYQDQVRLIGKSLDEDVKSIEVFDIDQAVDLHTVYQKEVIDNMNSDDPSSVLCNSFAGTSAHFIDYISTQQEWVRSHQMKYKDIIKGILDINIHKNYNGDKNTNKNVAESMRNASDIHLTPQTFEITRSLLTDMVNGVKSDFNPYQNRALNVIVNSISDILVKSGAKAAQLVFTGEGFTVQENNELSVIFDKIKGFPTNPPIVSSIVVELNSLRNLRNPQTNLSPINMPAEMSNMMTLKVEDECKMLMSIIPDESVIKTEDDLDRFKQYIDMADFANRVLFTMVIVPEYSGKFSEVVERQTTLNGKRDHAQVMEAEFAKKRNKWYRNVIK